MPTIKDIAREAGVSHGTVSNVINGRGNVSVEKIQLVWQTAERLGYKVNTKAQRLRQGIDRTIAVMLPGIEDVRYAAMYEVFQSEFMLRGYSVQLFSTRSMETNERTMFSDALNARVSAIIISSCLPDVIADYRSEAANLPLVFLRQSGPSYDDVMYAGFDAKQAGLEIAQYLHKCHAGRIGLFTDSASLKDTSLFLQGFYSIYAKEDPSIIAIDCPNHQINLRAFDFFSQDTAYDYIVCTDSRREEALRAASAYSSHYDCPRIITQSTRAAVTNPNAVIYELDYKRLAHRIVKTLCHRLEKESSLPARLNIKNDGFRAPTAPYIKAGRCLRMLTIASPSTSALSCLLPHLEKNTGMRLELTVLPSLQDVYEELQTSVRSRYDLIRMDVAWMDELAEHLFCPLKDIPFQWDCLLSKMVPELGENYTTTRGTRYCLPYDPSTQLMFYRRDIFTNPTIKRMYFEKYRTELVVPQTFDEYNKVAAFFTRSRNPESPVRYGSAVAVGNVVTSPSEFLPRLFEVGGKLLDNRGRISINTPEALSALENYRETYHCSDRTIHNVWKNVLEGFADGSAAMTVVFINYASHILNSKMSGIAGKLGFASVPGGIPLLGGGVIGITKDCAHPIDACHFLSWLYSDLIAPVFTTLGGLSPCRSVYKNRDINERYPWLSTARRSFSHAHRRGSSSYYSNFSELQLESILAFHVRQAVLGNVDAKLALQQAQECCDSYFQPSR